MIDFDTVLNSIIQMDPFQMRLISLTPAMKIQTAILPVPKKVGLFFFISANPG